MKKILCILILFSMLWADIENELWQKGQQCFLQKKYNEAIGCFEQVIAQNEDNFEAHYRLFECYTQIQEHGKALIFMEKSADLRPSYGIYLQLGNLAEKYKDDVLAESAYRKALTFKNSAKAYQRISIVLDAQNKSQEAWDYRVQGVELELPQVRGLQFKNAIIAGVKSRSELQDFLVEELEKEITPQKAKEMATTLFAFGMTKELLDIKTLYINLLTEQIGGFYNPETKKLYLISENKTFSFWENLFPLTRDDAEDRMVLAHEMTHALQDEYYDLLPLQQKFQGDDDMSLALTSLIEGDATLAMIDYNNFPAKALVQQKAAFRSMFSVMSFFGSFLGGQELSKAPTMIKDGLMFPYIEGFFFCLDLRGNNQQQLWQKIDLAYSNPPKSTEQILHPEKYRSNDAPLDFEYDIANILPPNKTLVTSNVMGEFGCQIVLRENNVSNYEKASAGWGGDRYFVFENDKNEISLLWLTAWDTKQDAVEFTNAYQKITKEQTLSTKVYHKNKYVIIAQNMTDDYNQKIPQLLNNIKVIEK